MRFVASCLTTGGVMLLGLFFGLMVLYIHPSIDVTVHSCDIYTPHPASALWNSLQSAAAFARKEGAVTLLDMGFQLFKIWILGIPPYYSSDIVRGKRLLVLGGSHISGFFPTARRLGVDVVLVDDAKLEEEMASSVHSFIPIEDFGRVSILAPDKVVASVLSVVSSSSVDGVTTLCEDQGPLAARLAHRLHFPASPPEAADIARNKLLFRERMREQGLSSPKFAAVRSRSDLRPAAELVGFPAFLKPAFGVAATFAGRVNSLEELEAMYASHQREIDPEAHPIYHFGNDMMLEETLQGVEIQLELMLMDGEVVFHCFSSEYAADRSFVVFPMNLTQTTRSAMLSLALSSVRAMGLSHGVLHLEMFHDATTGPQVIEVNNRLSRGFLPQQYIHQLIFGEKLVDYFASVAFLALGHPPPLYHRSSPLVSMAVFPQNASKVGWETKGPCAIFLASSPAQALAQGLQWQSNGNVSQSLIGFSALVIVSSLACLGLASMLKSLDQGKRKKE